MADDTTTIGAEPATDTGADDARAQADAHSDEVLSRILDDAEGVTPEKGERDRGPDGKFTKKEEPAEKATAKETKDTSEPDDAPPSDTVNPADYQKAIAALQRAKAPSALLDTMDPASATAWGLQLAEEQAKQDGFGKQLAELRSRVDGQPAAAAATSTVDLDEAVRPFVEYFGDDVAEPLTQFGQGLLAQVQAQLGPLTAAIQGQEREAARSRLDKQYDLGKDDRWQKILTHRDADANAYATEHEAIAAACRHCFADEIISDFESKLKAEHRKRSNGQSTTTALGAPVNPATVDDAETELLNAIQDGTPDDVLRISRKFPKHGSHEMLLSDKQIGVG